MPPRPVPAHLAGYKDAYARDPREAALAWFADAGLGLFLHYGVMSVHGFGDWGMYTQAMPLAEYDTLIDRFTAEGFDAEAIGDVALEMGARYVNLTTKHHDGFCLFETEVTDFHAMRSPARRDLVGELAESCRTRGLGFFLYYSYALDWRHPWFFSREYFDRARPPYETPEPRYRFRKPEDFRRYIDDAHAHLRELLTHYGPVAGVWFDPVMAYLAARDLFPIDETYALIRSLQPHALISFKAGATGDEDFAAPERSGTLVMKKVADRLGAEAAAHHAQVVEKNRDKPNEICDTLSWSWAWHTRNEEVHATPDDILTKLAEAKRRGWNLLINSGPRPDGSLPPEDVATLREVGRRLRAGDVDFDALHARFSHDEADDGPAPIA